MRVACSVAIVLAIFFCALSAQAFDCLERATDRIKSGDEAAADELAIAKADVAKFRPKERTGERRPSKKELLSLIGLNHAPGEIERFFGLGGGVER